MTRNEGIEKRRYLWARGLANILALQDTWRGSENAFATAYPGESSPSFLDVVTSQIDGIEDVLSDLRGLMETTPLQDECPLCGQPIFYSDSFAKRSTQDGEVYAHTVCMTEEVQRKYEMKSGHGKSCPICGQTDCDHL